EDGGRGAARRAFARPRDEGEGAADEDAARRRVEVEGPRGRARGARALEGASPRGGGARGGRGRPRRLDARALLDLDAHPREPAPRARGAAAAAGDARSGRCAGVVALIPNKRGGAEGDAEDAERRGNRPPGLRVPGG